MGQLTVAGVQYNNPAQVDQNTNLDPATGQPWFNGIQPYTFTVPATPPTYKVGANSPLTPGTQATTTALGNPQPGSFVPGSPQISTQPVFNQDPPVVGKGQPISVGGASGSTGNPSVDLNRQVSGQVPNGPVFRNPA